MAQEHHEMRSDVPNLNHMSDHAVWAEYYAADTRGWFNRWWNQHDGGAWHWERHDMCLARILGPLTEC